MVDSKTPSPFISAASAFSAASYFSSGQFDKDVGSYQECTNRTTGYAGLDNLQPFYPGLYCLGAISSLGKTTFAHQMADQIAMSGNNVLYFSLEQTCFELYSKSLARSFKKACDKNENVDTGQYPLPSSIDIRLGKYSDEIKEQREAYANAVGDRLCVIDEPSLTVEYICKLTKNYMTRTETVPVVIVDYLQIIAPTPTLLSDGRLIERISDIKTSIDHSVHELKVMQRNFNLSVLLISSLNRQNYITTIDFESFKESGGIEYTADVVWGLQLAVLNEALFHKEGNVNKKREIIREAKAKPRREIELVCLKNRYGISSYKLPFTYIPASDYFISEEPEESV